MSGEYPTVAPSGLFLANVDAGDRKMPVISVVEVKEHRSPLREDLGDQRALHTGVIIGFSDVGEEGVALGAVEAVQVVAELEAVIEVEFQRLDQRLRQIIERVFPEEANRGAELLISDLEDVGLQRGIFKSDHGWDIRGKEKEGEQRTSRKTREGT